jgi:threonine dehydratase
MKLVVEPSGAMGIAALLGSKVNVSGRFGFIISGGTIDAPTMKLILES